MKLNKLNVIEEKFCDIVYKYQKYNEKVFVESLKYKIDIKPNNITKPISKVKVSSKEKKFYVDFIKKHLNFLRK